MTARRGTTYGFAKTDKLVAKRVRQASESRGFAETRVLTHWEEVVGADIAAISRPVEVSYRKAGMGATLVLLTNGANAPILDMRRKEIIERVNAVYGYGALRHVHITQTARSGFAEGQVDFVHRPKPAAATGPDPQALAEGRRVAEGIGDGDLRAALERLAANVISKTSKRGRGPGNKT